MDSVQPIIAIIGSARSEIVGAKETAARSACLELGRELAQADWRIAVYSSDNIFIESDVVAGYVTASTTPKTKSIIGFFSSDYRLEFPEMSNQEDMFDTVIDASDDWEVTFYRSLTTVNAVLILGGGSSSLIAGHIAITMNLPIIAIEEFDGSGKKLWKHLSTDPKYLEREDIQAMAGWDKTTAKNCVNSLVRQYHKHQTQVQMEIDKLELIKTQAGLWVQHLADERVNNLVLMEAIIFVIVFLILLIAGLTVSTAGFIYTAIIVFGLCSAGGLGAILRMLAQTAPDKANLKTAPILGIMVGLILSIIYLLPQLIGNASFLVPNSTIEPTTRVQFLSAIVVAALAGIAFDSTINQLQRRAEERGQEILKKSP